MRKIQLGSQNTTLILLLLFLLLIPFMVSEYMLNMVITMVIYSLFVLSYNILFGKAGLLSFGHAAYFGMGAYTALIVIKNCSFSLPMAIVAGGVAGAILGLFFGVFVVRLGGTYFALLTLAFNQLIYAGAEKFRSLTGGEDGIAAQRPDLYLPGIGTIEMFPTTNWYYFVVIVVFICGYYCYHFNQTPLGRLNECLRENEDRLRFLGYNIYLSKLLIYVISAFFAGIAGSLAATFQEFASVSFINLDKATEVLIMTFIGGSGTFWGPIIGVCFLTYLNDILSTLTEHWAIIQGAIFVALVMYAPQGLSGILVNSYRAVFQKRRNTV